MLLSFLSLAFAYLYAAYRGRDLKSDIQVMQL